MEPYLLRANGVRVPYPPAGPHYTLEELQRAVGGYIEIINFDGGLMVLHEEGKIEGLPRNEEATRRAHQATAIFPDDYIAGDVLITPTGLLEDDEEEEADSEEDPPDAGGPRDLRLASNAEKVEVYEEIEKLHLAGAPVLVTAHSSGFPAIEIRCGDIHILTDTLSAEDWRRTKEPRG